MTRDGSGSAALSSRSVASDRIVHYVVLAWMVGIVTLSVFLWYHDRHFDKGKDAHEYTLLGKALWNGEGLIYQGRVDVIQPPGFPLVAGLVDLAMRRTDWAGKTVSLLAFFASLWVAFVLVKSLTGDAWVARLSVVLFSSSSNAILNASSGYSESLYCLGLLLMALFFWRHFPLRTTIQCVIFGFAWVFLYCVRPEGLLCGTALLLFGWTRDISMSIRSTIKVSLLAVVLLLPYVLFLREHTGQWQLSGKTYANLVMGELGSPYQKGKATDRYAIVRKTHEDPSYSRGIWHYLQTSPECLLRRVPHNAAQLTTFLLNNLTVMGLMIAVWGFVALPSAQRTFILLILVTALTYIGFFVLYRTLAIHHWIWAMAFVVGSRECLRFTFIRLRKGWNETTALLIPVVALSLYELRSAAAIALRAVQQ